MFKPIAFAAAVLAFTSLSDATRAAAQTAKLPEGRAVTTGAPSSGKVQIQRQPSNETRIENFRRGRDGDRQRLDRTGTLPQGQTNRRATPVCQPTQVLIAGQCRKLKPDPARIQREIDAEARAYKKMKEDRQRNTPTIEHCLMKNGQLVCKPR